MNKNYTEDHTVKAKVVEELAKRGYAPEIDLSQTTSAPKAEEVPFDAELMALANNPDLVEGHLQKWRGVNK